MECGKDPKIHRDYFKGDVDCPEYVVQEVTDGFTRNWETRVFWFDGEFRYANKAAVSTEDGQEGTTSRRSSWRMPSELLSST